MNPLDQTKSEVAATIAGLQDSLSKAVSDTEKQALSSAIQRCTQLQALISSVENLSAVIGGATSITKPEQAEKIRAAMDAMQAQFKALQP